MQYYAIKERDRYFVVRMWYDYTEHAHRKERCEIGPSVFDVVNSLSGYTEKQSLCDYIWCTETSSMRKNNFKPKEHSDD